ncbi:MAG TPA: hypothetical protein VNH11_29650 [Pirellulales bacterium]|nr:hypothetical protein [Pirellulales bacterium]HVC96635.1 hypothetical protein [Pirellulales bacterium]
MRLVASVVPLGHGQAVVVSGDGHWLGTRGAEKEIVYVIRTAAGQETLTPREFYKRFVHHRQLAAHHFHAARLDVAPKRSQQRRINGMFLDAVDENLRVGVHDARSGKP